MELGSVQEVQELESACRVNELLATGEWELLAVKVEKVKKPVGKEKVGVDSASNWNTGVHSWDRFKIKYEESLVSIYILGRK